ncbi:MAG: hypothetical protein ABH875_01590 [Candidatus Omnitrophota bacterium]
MSATNIIWGFICGFLYLLALEIRNRQIFEELPLLRRRTDELQKEVEKLKADLQLKKNIYDEAR